MPQWGRAAGHKRAQLNSRAIAVVGDHLGPRVKRQHGRCCSLFDRGGGKSVAEDRECLDNAPREHKTERGDGRGLPCDDVSLRGERHPSAAPLELARTVETEEPVHGKPDTDTRGKRRIGRLVARVPRGGEPALCTSDVEAGQCQLAQRQPQQRALERSLEVVCQRPGTRRLACQQHGLDRLKPSPVTDCRQAAQRTRIRHVVSRAGPSPRDGVLGGSLLESVSKSVVGAAARPDAVSQRPFGVRRLRRGGPVQLHSLGRRDAFVYELTQKWMGELDPHDGAPAVHANDAGLRCALACVQRGGDAGQPGRVLQGGRHSKHGGGLDQLA